MIGRAEIDRRAPFNSVKEAVSMFGDKVLAGEVYTSKLKAGAVIYDDEHTDSFRSITVDAAAEELEQTRRSLIKVREESMEMEKSILLLRQELETTKRELRQLRRENRCRNKPVIDVNDDEAEDMKFAEDTAEVAYEVQKKTYVRFESPVPIVSREVMDQGAAEGEAVLKRHPSLRKKIKKPLLPLIVRGIFSRKSTRSDDAIKS